MAINSCQTSLCQHNLFVSVVFLIMGSRNVNQFLIQARDENMLNGDYVFISIDADPGKICLVGAGECFCDLWCDL